MIDTTIEVAVARMQTVIELGRVIRDRKTMPAKVLYTVLTVQFIILSLSTVLILIINIKMYCYVNYVTKSTVYNQHCQHYYWALSNNNRHD